MQDGKYLKYFLLIGLVFSSIEAGAQSQSKLKKRQEKGY